MKIKNLKIKSLRVKIVLLVGALMGFLGISITGYSVFVHYNDTVEVSKQQLYSSAETKAGIIQAELEDALDTARTLAQTFSAVNNPENPLELSREDVNIMLQKILENNPDFLGIYTAWEPDAFDGQDTKYAGSDGHDSSGRFIPYWVYSDGKIVLVPLEGYTEEGIGDYYLIPEQNRQEIILDPYIYPIEGKDVLLTSLVVPIISDNTFLGIVGVDISLEFIQDMISSFESEEGQETLIVVSYSGILAGVGGHDELTGQFISEYQPDWEEELEIIQAGEAVVKTDEEEMEDHTHSGEMEDEHAEADTEEEEGRVEIYTPILIGNTTTPWAFNINLPLKEITQEAIKGVWIIILIGAAALIISLFILWLVMGASVKPIRKLASISENVSGGKLDDEINIRQDDEIGQLADAFRNMIQYLQKMAKAAESLAENDLSIEVEAFSENDRLGNSFQKMINDLNRIKKYNFRNQLKCGGVKPGIQPAGKCRCPIRECNCSDQHYHPTGSQRLQPAG